MRFLLGVLVGYSMRGKKKLPITVLATLAFTVYIILPAIALLALRLEVQHERQSRPAQNRVPALKGLSYENAETILHTSNLNIRLLATRRNLPLQPGLIIDQNPQPGEEVVYGYPVGVTITKTDSHDHGQQCPDCVLLMKLGQSCPLVFPLVNNLLSPGCDRVSVLCVCGIRESRQICALLLKL